MEKQYEAGEANGIEKGIKKGIEKGLEKGLEKGMEVLIASYTEDGASESVIEEKLVRKYGLTPEEAKDKIAAYGKRTKE